VGYTPKVVASPPEKMNSGEKEMHSVAEAWRRTIRKHVKRWSEEPGDYGQVK
jgi:hypothetical protein